MSHVVSGVLMWRFLSIHHVRHHHKGQNTHYYQSNRDHNDDHHHGVVAIIRRKHPSYATSHPVRRSAHIYSRRWCETFLYGPNRQNCALFIEAACYRSVLEDQFAFAAFKAHRLSPLHLRWQLAENMLIVAKLWQVSAMPDFCLLPAHRARQLLDLHRRDIDASQTL